MNTHTLSVRTCIYFYMRSYQNTVWLCKIWYVRTALGPSVLLACCTATGGCSRSSGMGGCGRKMCGGEGRGRGFVQSDMDGWTGSGLSLELGFLRRSTQTPWPKLRIHSQMKPPWSLFIHSYCHGNNHTQKAAIESPPSATHHGNERGCYVREHARTLDLHHPVALDHPLAQQ